MTDADRELATRGFRDARSVGRWLAERGLVPDHVVVSPARRTLQTCETVMGELGATPTVVEDERIYDNSVRSLLSVLHDVADDAQTVAMIGHNPSMHGLTVSLDDGLGDPQARAAVSVAFPTSATAVLEVAVPWSQLALGGATMRDFAAPRG